MAFPSASVGFVVATLLAQAVAVPVARLNKDRTDEHEVRHLPRLRPTLAPPTPTRRAREM